MASTVARATPRAVPRHPAWASPIACCTGDRKSTRLNSSHSQISYAVFCLKKKKVVREVGLRIELKKGRKHLYIDSLFLLVDEYVVSRTKLIDNEVELTTDADRISQLAMIC